MGRTKKVGTTGRFGARYGSRIRKRVREIEEVSKRPQKCPKCETRSVRRVSVGIWECRRCGAKMTGGAWVLVTSQAKVAARTSAAKRREMATKR
ncbi:MAG: 50S ribosomal protein L37Ae [Promethearchaeota archaeon]